MAMFHVCKCLLVGLSWYLKDVLFIFFKVTNYNVKFPEQATDVGIHLSYFVFYCTLSL